MGAHTLLFAYLSPETCLPLTSVVAAAVGMLMMFGRTTVRFVMQRVFPSARKTRNGHPAVLRGPHRVASLQRASRLYEVR